MGYNFSMINYDTVANGVQGSMNLFWNQAAMHSNVYPSLFMTPTMNFGSFTPYNMNFSNNWLLDPGFALTNTFNQFGMQCPWTMGCGLNLGNNSSSSSTAKTDEEIDAEEKRKELNKIIGELKDAKILSENDKKKIENASKDAKDAGCDLVDQYEAYKAKFEEIIATKGVKIEHELLTKGDKFRLDNGKVEDARLNLGIGSDYKVTNGLSVREMNSSVKSSNVIAFVEAFQDQHGNIIDEVIGYGNEATESEAFEQLQTALIGKARSLKSKLDSNSKEALNDAISALEECSIVYDAENKTRSYEPSGKDAIKARFNNLYVMTRIILAKDLDNQIKAKYGVHSELFNKNLFEEAVLEDLSDDGYDVDGIPSVTLDEDADVDTDELTEEDIEERNRKIEQKKDQERINELNKLLTISSYYTVSSVTVTTSDGRTVNAKKLVPDDTIENGSVYYVVENKIYKADNSGNFDSNADEIKNVNRLFDKNSFVDIRKNDWMNSLTDSLDDSLDDPVKCFYDPVNNESLKEYITDKEGYMQLASDDWDHLDKGEGYYYLEKILDSIKTLILNAAPISEQILDKAIYRMKKEYKEHLDNISNSVEDLKCGEAKEYEIAPGKKGTRFVYMYEHDDDMPETKEKVQDYKWNVKDDTGLVYRYENQTFDEGSNLLINMHVLVKKLEYYVQEAAKEALNS